MKSRIALFILLACCTGAFAQSAQDSFTKLKSLDGNWSGKTGEGKPVEITFRVMSGGSSLMSEIKSEENMITMFHMDGDRLMMTHYCGAGNQPRMVATPSPDGKTFTFNYLDATNLLSSQPGHMERLVVTMNDANHHTEEWDFATGAGPKMHERFDVQRGK